VRSALEKVVHRQLESSPSELTSSRSATNRTGADLLSRNAVRSTATPIRLFGCASRGGPGGNFCARATNGRILFW